ncbi:hypothetical protein GGH94_002751 [Coemansia aciculifera]|uniref:CRIB domain-containing protein n=1 Tax=Coemansia aciculifera TaxID=417176 RepID=A0A9W8M5P1_9FUNG|nr:hypothetical protein GGH94_002751 [Coemansia aciculifera]KAJ2873884.1 hypothetical protein GGH93_002846 [Coemansia aciculifera]
MADKSRDISIVVVGGSYAGAAAAKKLADLSKKGYTGLKVTLVDEKSHYFHAIGFPKALVDAKYAAKAFLPFSAFFENGTQHQFINSRLKSITDAHHLELENGQQVYYDYLVLATGGKAPGPINVSATSKDEGLAEIEQLRVGLQDAGSVLVIGGGAVGVEVAGFVAATFPQKKVTLVHSGKRLMPTNFRDGVSNGAVAKLGQIGVDVVLNERVELPSDFGHNAHVGHKVLRGTSGTEYPSDVQILAVGFKVNSAFLEPLESKTGSLLHIEDGPGFIRVRPTLQLDSDSFPNIFVPGDANDLPMTAKYGFKAEMQGGTAAANIKKLIDAGFDQSFSESEDSAIANAPALGKWSDMVDAIMVPIGPDLGVVQMLKVALGGSGIANFLVRQIKSKDFMLWMRKGYFPNKQQTSGQ